MMSFLTQTADMKQSGATASTVADAALAMHPDEPLGNIDRGMPGSSSAQAARQIGQAWKESLNSWAREVQVFAEALQDSAQAYEVTDSRASQAYRGIGR